MAETVRIDPKAHAKLAALARAKHLPLTEVLARAINAYERAERMAQFNAAYAELRSDPTAWQQELDERALWAHTNKDGLVDDDWQAREPAAAENTAKKAARRAPRRGKR